LKNYKIYVIKTTFKVLVALVFFIHELKALLSFPWQNVFLKMYIILSKPITISLIFLILVLLALGQCVIFIYIFRKIRSVGKKLIDKKTASQVTTSSENEVG
jgi:hypothetical protein